MSKSTAIILKQAGKLLRLMLIVTSNAYRDREQEIVSEKALRDQVDRWWNDDVFVGNVDHLLWHDGDPIGQVIWAGMRGPFLVQVSRELPNTMINLARRGESPMYTTVKEVWDALENETDLAASHRFFYDVSDIQDDIYDMIEQTEVTTLPGWAAANLVTLSEVVNA